MSFLLDTNCWMQLVRDREHAGEVRALLAAVPLKRVFVSIYSLHSIGTVLAGRGWMGDFGNFIDRMSIGRDIRVVATPVEELRRVEDACLGLKLDFDDAYQYVTAELHGLKLVSLDADFDRTPNGRLAPAAALQAYTDEQARQKQQP